MRGGRSKQAFANSTVVRGVEAGSHPQRCDLSIFTRNPLENTYKASRLNCTLHIMLGQGGTAAHHAANCGFIHILEWLCLCDLRSE